MKCVLCINPSLRSSGQPRRSARGPTPDSKPVPQSRVLTRSRPIYMFWRWGKPKHPEETHVKTGGTWKLHIKRSCPIRESRTRPSCNEVTGLTTEPPCHPKTAIFYEMAILNFWQSEVCLRLSLVVRPGQKPSVNLSLCDVRPRLLLAIFRLGCSQIAQCVTGLRCWRRVWCGWRA